ncbi:MAG: alcohol acetyltransferase [Bacilli bacterium]|nr:alcohol acetyltransferase [Bacilli bacterium]
MNRWYKLDNAAKIFPSVTSAKRSNVFRLSAVLKEKVDPALLEEALNLTITRFPSLKVKLKRGLFWYYLEENEAKASVRPDSPYICQRFKRRENNAFLFRVTYYLSKINLEVFHSLTDGTGALEFLKTITYNYLLLTGKEIDSENLILTSDFENVYEEYQDSFVQNYDASLKNNQRDPKALQFRGSLYANYYISIITGELDVLKLKEVARQYGATITEFLTSCLIFSAKSLTSLIKREDKPFQVLVPVNLRKHFPSKTLRNFSLFISPGTKLRADLTFEEIITEVKLAFESELQKEKLQQRIVANVTIEKNFFLRIVPLVIKEFVLRIGYSAWGDKLNSMSFSNVGQVKLPKDMEAYVQKFIFSNSASKTSPINLGAISYQDKLQVSFASSIHERDLQREFFRLLSSHGLEIIIETNELEV